MMTHLRSLKARLFRSQRRGVSAMEFGLVAPILIVMVMGLIDYGWFFSREALITSALEGAVRAGGNTSPAMNETPGQCATCIAKTKAYAVEAIGALGVTVQASDFNPTIVAVQGTCAIELCPTLTHTPLLGMVPMPTSYGGVCTIALAQTVKGC